jgi:hypothetical protein
MAILVLVVMSFSFELRCCNSATIQPERENEQVFIVKASSIHPDDEPADISIRS